MSSTNQPTPPPELATVVVDANVLYSNNQRNVIVTMAVDGLFRLRGSERIEDEWVRNLVANRPDKDPSKLRRTASLVRQNVPGYIVVDYARHEGAAGHTDAKDRHVAAAAMSCAPSDLVTWNVRDFDFEALSKKGVLVRTPDEFLCWLLDEKPEATVASTRRSLNFVQKDGKPAQWPEYLEMLETSGRPSSLVGFVQKLRAFGRDDLLTADDSQEEQSLSGIDPNGP